MKEISNKYREIRSYLIVGVLTTFVSMATYYCSVLTFLNPENPIELQFANIISWIFAVSFSYLANRKFVFQSENKKIFKEVVGFFCSRLITLVIDMLLMFGFVTVFGLNDKVIKILAQTIVIVLNYILGKFYVFRKGTKNKIFCKNG